jgi:hypothetical protein
MFSATIFLPNYQQKNTSRQRQIYEAKENHLSKYHRNNNSFGMRTAKRGRKRALASDKHRNEYAYSNDHANGNKHTHPTAFERACFL